jgi:hypothetical protein
VKIIAVADYAGLGIIGSMGMLALYAVVWLVLFGSLGYWVAHQCGRNPDEGMILGFLFGPIGVLVEGLLPKFPPRNPS